MHRLVPDFIVQRFSAGEMGGGFKTAGLFVDISGFSTLTDGLMARGQHGAEVLATIMRAVFEPLLQSVYEQGGFVVTLAGDAFTALFPLEGTHAPGHACALAAAWAIQERMAAVAQQPTPDGTFSLAAKIGLAAGEVDWGIVFSTDGARATHYFRGTAIDGCAAAEKRAHPGDVILAPELYAAVRGSVTVERVRDAVALGDHYRLTGLTAPLPPPEAVDLPPVDLGVTAQFFPPGLVTQSHSGEFRHVVNLFISLPTVRTEAQLAIFMGSLFALQDRYGGLLNRVDFGDKGSHLLLFWGAPVAHENDVERALNFVLDLQTQTSIPINAGVTYRIAHAGFIGSALREEYTCFGRGVNLAARFMTHAARGEIWLDEAVAQRAERHYDLEFEGAMRFKGFAQPQRVYVLYERKEQGQPFFQQELVGRETELARLADFCAALRDGQYAGIMVIWGEAGIGKSRLVHELRRKLSPGSEEGETGPGIRWFLCQADEILRESLNPFRYWLRQYFGQSQAQTESRKKRSFNRTLDQLIDGTQDEVLAETLDRTRSFLGALVDLHWPDSSYAQLDPQGRYENTFMGLISLLQAESLQGPVIIHLEDAHWLDAESQAFLARLVRTLAAEEDVSYPLALIITARPGGSAAGRFPGEGLAYREIDLGQLSHAGVARLAEAQLGGPATARLLRLLVERAEGNPFFAEQILRYLQERSLLVSGEGGWQIADEPEALLLPTDVRALLVARLDQLALRVKEVVQTAAVLGREFEIRLLARMLQHDNTLLEQVAEAERAAIWAALSEMRYIFRHALLRDAAYQMQVRARRQALHALAMTSLENLYATGVTPSYGELAYHAEGAGLADKARAYLHQAGDAARDAYENSLAIDYYSRALDLVAAGDRETRYRLLLAREAMWHLQGRRDEQHKDLAALREVAQESKDLNDQAEVALRRSRYAGVIGEHQAAIAAAQNAVNIALEAGRADQAARGYRQWGWYLMRQTAYDDALRRLGQALKHARAAGEPKLEADSLNSLGALFLETEEHAAALEHYEQARALYQQTGNRVGESSTWNNQGNVARAQGNYDDAVRHYERALAIRRQIGYRRGEGNTLYNLGGANRALRRYVRARACYEGALAIARQIGDRRGEGLALNSLALLAANLGEYARAWANCEKSLTIFQRIGDRMLACIAHTNLGRFALDEGRFEAARQQYQLGLDVARKIGSPGYEGYTLHGLGEVMLGLGQLDEAAAHFEQAIAMLSASSWSLELVKSRSGLARVVLGQGELSRAAELVEEILHEFDSNSMPDSEQLFRVYLTCVQVLEARQDPRAGAVLRSAHDRLQEQASRIPDSAMRQAFLHNVADHRQLIDAYQKLR